MCNISSKHTLFLYSTCQHSTVLQTHLRIFFSYGLLSHQEAKHGFSFMIPPILIVSSCPSPKLRNENKHPILLLFKIRTFDLEYLPLPHWWPQIYPIACNAKGWLCQSYGGAKRGEVFAGIINCVTIVTSPPTSPTSNSNPQTLPKPPSHWNASDADKGSKNTHVYLYTLPFSHLLSSSVAK